MGNIPRLITKQGSVPMKIVSSVLPCASLVTVACVLTAPVPGFAQTASVLRFEPPSVPGGSLSISSWSEGNFRFVGMTNVMVHADSGAGPNQPDNGSAWLGTVGSVGAVFLSNTVPGRAFSLLSVDLSEYDNSLPVTNIIVTGFRTTGVITQVFRLEVFSDGTGPGQDFQTFFFSPGFTNLRSVQIRAGRWALDNLRVVETVSVPPTNPPVPPVRRVVAWGGTLEPDIVPGFSNIAAIAAGQYFSLGLQTDGRVVSLSTYQSPESDVPADLPRARAIAAGAAHGLALLTNGTVRSWGFDAWGQVPVPSDLSNVVAISGGGIHSLALLSNGTVRAWGDNTSRQLEVPVDLSGVRTISAGAIHNLALLSNGTVVAWGDGTFGQLDVPEGLSGVIAVAAGGTHSLALRNDRTVVAWGGLYGAGNVPLGLTNVIGIAAGHFFSLALRQGGTVVGWGDNSAGQLDAPTGLNGVLALDGGLYFTLALSTNRAPFAHPAATSVKEGQGTVLFLTGSSPSPASPVFTITRLPVHGTLMQNGGPPITSVPTTISVGATYVFYEAGPAQSNPTLDEVEFTIEVDGQVSAPARIRIEILPLTQPPVAIASVLPSLFLYSLNNEDAPALLDGSASSDPDGDALTYSWFVDGMAIGSGVVLSNVFTLGDHTVMLIVADGFYSATNTVPVRVQTLGEGVEALAAVLAQSNLPRRHQRPLLMVLKAATAAFDRGQLELGAAQLDSFIRKVQSRIAPLDPALAAELSAIAQRLIEVAGGG